MKEPKKGRGRPKSKDLHKPRKHLPIPESLHQRLERIADTNDRPIVREAIRGLKAHCEAEEVRLGIAPPADKDKQP